MRSKTEKPCLIYQTGFVLLKNSKVAFGFNLFAFSFKRLHHAAHTAAAMHWRACRCVFRIVGQYTLGSQQHGCN